MNKPYNQGKTTRKLQEIAELAQKLDQRRMVLRITNYLLWAGMLLSLILGPQIYPYGFIIFGVFLIFKLTVWRMIKKTWERTFIAEQTCMGWEEQGVSVAYEPKPGIEHQVMESFDLAPGRKVAGCLSLERIRAEFSGVRFEASDFSLSFEKPKKVAPYPFITGAWLIFERDQGAYPELKLKKRSLTPQEMKDGLTLLQLLDSSYPNEGAAALSQADSESLKRLLIQYPGVVFVFAGGQTLHLVFENIFVNFKPSLSQKIHPGTLQACTFEEFSEIRRLALQLRPDKA